LQQFAITKLQDEQKDARSRPPQHHRERRYMATTLLTIAYVIRLIASGDTRQIEKAEAAKYLGAPNRRPQIVTRHHSVVEP
jgi:hypothetical protein